MPSDVLITGGAGYIGAGLALDLLAAGRAVRVLDSGLHGQRGVLDRLREAGADVVEADVRDAGARRAALEGTEAVVHLAAIVGDPACARDPEGSRQVNLDASSALVEEAVEAGTSRFVFASTCSNYGRMPDPSVPVDERAELRPVSLYAEQKVEIERKLLALPREPVAATCLRFATVYGVAARMRFDLTVNEFTRDLWAGRRLEVFGEQFWRPYVHVRDATRAIGMVLSAPREQVAGEVFNVGTSSENFRKLDLVRMVEEVVPETDVAFVQRTEDPRDYRVAFEKVRDVLGFRATETVASGIREVVEHLEAEAFGDPWDPRLRNTP